MKFEILITDKLRFKSTKSDLRPSSSSLPFVYPVFSLQAGQAPFIGCGSLWSLEKFPLLLEAQMHVHVASS